MNELPLIFFFSFKIIIKQLKDKVDNIKTEIEEKATDVNTHHEQKSEARQELSELITNCEQLYNEYDVVRIQVRQAISQMKQFSLIHVLVRFLS